MTVGADEPGTVDAAEGPSPSGTGFYIALAAWIPLGLFLLLVATPPTQSGDCGFWGCPTNNAFAEGLLLVPGTPVILALAAWAQRRATHVLEVFPDSVEAGTASTTRFVARLAAFATIAAWAWVLHY